MNIIHGLRKTVEMVPEQLAFVDKNRTITYRDFDLQTTKLACSFTKALHLKKGQRIILALPNSVDNVLCMFAAYKAGLIVVPTNTMLKDFEIEHLLKDTEAPVMITTSEFMQQLPPNGKFRHLQHIVFAEFSKSEGQKFHAHLLDHLIAAGKDTFKPLHPDSQDIGAIFYTSGTTGKRKGALLSHGLLYDHSAAVVQVLSMSKKDRHLVVLPMSHLFVQGVVLIPSILSGGTSFIVRRFDAEATLSGIVRNQITMMAGVGTMFGRIVDLPDAASYDLSGLRRVIAGAAPLNPRVAERFLEIFGIDILRSFGSSETGVIAMTPAGGTKKYGSIGRVLPGITVSIQDEDGKQMPVGESGELMVHRSCVMSGYLNYQDADEEIFRGGIWYCTGDLVKMDEEGYIYIEGRKKEMINTSGYSVFPKEVETVIGKLDQVREVAVVGLPDEERGEIVGAFIVPKDDDLSKETVLEYCKKHLGGYKVPRKIAFLHHLPMTPTGKIAKKILYENYLENQSNEYTSNGG